MMVSPMTSTEHTPDPEVFFVTSSEEGVRIDKLLAARLSHHSRTYFQYLIEQGCVLLNGETVKKRQIPEEGDEIEVLFQALPEISLTPQNIPLEILYEDDFLIAVNKPCGMVVHPAPGHWNGTFVNALLHHCSQLAALDPLRPGIVHRLDRDTSGLLIAAKTTESHRRLIAQFTKREIEKQYLAICVGRPKNGLLSAPIGRHPVHRKEMTVLADGREAQSDIHVVAFNDRLSLVLIKPKTGRTHQIRVHMKHLGTPVLGDEIYGSSSANATHGVSRQLLHAYRLSFQHPITNLPIHLTAPLPEDMKDWIQLLCGPTLCQTALA